MSRLCPTTGWALVNTSTGGVWIGPVHSRRECGKRRDNTSRWVQVNLREIADSELLVDMKFCKKCFGAPKLVPATG